MRQKLREGNRKERQSLLVSVSLILRLYYQDRQMQFIGRLLPGWKVISNGLRSKGCYPSMWEELGHLNYVKPSGDASCIVKCKKKTGV